MILDSSRTTTTACARATSSHTPTGTARQQCLIHLILICNVIDNSDSVYFGSASHIYFLSHSFIPNLIVFINLTGKYERYRGKKSHFILHLARLIALGYNSIVLLIAQRVETLLCTVKLSLERDHLRLTNWCTEANTGSCQGAARISPFICNFDCTQKRSEMRWEKFSSFFPAHQRSSFSCFLSSSALWRAKNEANSFNILCAHLKWDKREKKLN